jgi:hypothetical protein
MKFFRTALILGIVAVLAGFAYWYFEVKKKKEKEEIKVREALLFGEKDRQIEKLSLKTEDSEEIVLEWVRLKPAGEDVEDDEEGTWFVREPIQTGGDTVAIDTMITSMFQGSTEEVIWESLEKEAEYGLDNPTLSLRFYYEGDDTPHGIDLGKETLDHKKIFAKVIGEERIYTVPATILNVLKRDLFGLRDKKLAPFEKEDIEAVSVLTGFDLILLEKDGEEWYLMPDKVKASETRVDIYTGTLRWESFVEVVEERGTSFAEYGLDNPRLLLTFKLRDGSNFIFIVGDVIEEGDAQFFYATRSSDNMVFQMKGETVQKLLTSKFHLKERKIFDFDRSLVNRATFVKEDVSYTFEKRDVDEWELVETENVQDAEEFLGQMLDRGYMIDNVVRGISTAEYEDFEPLERGDANYEKTGIDDPTYRIEFQFEDATEPVSVVVTERDEQSGKAFLSPDNGETAYYASAYFLTNFPESVGDLFE